MKLMSYLKEYNLFLILGIIIFLGLISYINIYNNQFLWDDEHLIQENIFIRSFEYLPDIFTTSMGAGVGKHDNFYRPAQLTVYTILNQLMGLNPWAFHLLNILLHLSNALLIFFLIYKIFKKKFVAFLTSLLWVIHPVHTEAITYMSGTADPLSIFFALCSFLLYLKFKEIRKLWVLVISGILYVLALLSKETIIILPALFILYEFIFSDKKLNWKQYKWIAPFFIIALIYFYFRFTVLNFGGTLNLYEDSNIYTQHFLFRIFTFLASLLMYYSFLFLPVNLHMERQFPVFISLFSPQVLFSLIILVILSFIVYKNISKSRSLLVFGILWFFISFLPMSGIIPVNSLLLEHWLYFPSIGFFLVFSTLICWLWDKFIKYRNFVAIGIFLMIIILTGLTLNRNQDWKDPITFYNNILQYNEGTPRVHNNLAMAYVDESDLASAEKHYIKAIQISDTYPQTHYNLARLYLRVGQVERAIFHLKRSIEINPNFFLSYLLLGNIFEQMGENKLAEEYYGKADTIQYY